MQFNIWTQNTWFSDNKYKMSCLAHYYKLLACLVDSRLANALLEVCCSCWPTVSQNTCCFVSGTTYAGRHDLLLHCSNMICVLWILFMTFFTKFALPLYLELTPPLTHTLLAQVNTTKHSSSPLTHTLHVQVNTTKQSSFNSYPACPSQHN